MATAVASKSDERRKAKELRRAENRRRAQARDKARDERDAKLSKLHDEYAAKVEAVWREWRDAGKTAS